MSKINLKICGITNKASIVRAHQNNVNSRGFASNNLNGPNTTNDKNIKKLIKECNYYKIESVLLTKYYSIDEILKTEDNNQKLDELKKDIQETPDKNFKPSSKEKMIKLIDILQKRP